METNTLIISLDHYALMAKELSREANLDDVQLGELSANIQELVAQSQKMRLKLQVKERLSALNFSFDYRWNKNFKDVYYILKYVLKFMAVLFKSIKDDRIRKELKKLSEELSSIAFDLKYDRLKNG